MEIGAESPLAAWLAARLAGMGLSSDPAKRRRQLAGLQRGAERRVERLRELAAACDPEPGSSDAASLAAGEPGTVSSPAVSEAAPGARIVPGRYTEPPAPAAPPAATEPAVDVVDPPAGELERQADELELEVIDEPAEPGRAVKLAAAVLGVRR